MTQPEALRLADLIRSRHGNEVNDEAAAELRRQHGEIKSMRTERLRSERRLSAVEAQRDALLEALKKYRKMMFVEAGCRFGEGDAAITNLQAALAQQAEPLNLRDPAVQKRLATQWGYVPAAAQAEPVEPVAWNWMLDGLPYGRACYGDPPDADLAERAATAGRTVRLLYTAPPQRKPLTEEEIERIGMTHQSLRQVVRAVERAHGIKE